jgi:hypothetical protein
MRVTICFTAAILYAASAGAKPAAHVGRQLNETTWSYVEDGKQMRMSIDADGKYIEKTVGGKLMGHGTAVMKGPKDCFTPFMSKDGEHCWTSQPLKIGQSMVSVSDKGERLTVTRIKYMPLSMSK